MPRPRRRRRWRAPSGARSDSSARIVAIPTLIGFERPSDFVSTSRIPADSTTARMEPPAMTPVPADAGRRSTFAAPKSEAISCGMVRSVSGTRMTCFFASSTPFLIASGTSSALPRPAPTCPRPSPTTTTAEKLKRRPPFTTFATRLICTTRSVSSSLFESIFAIFLPVCFLELQAGFACAVGERLDPPVVKRAATVEYHALDALLLRPLREELADLRGGLALLRLLTPELETRRGRERPATVVVDELCVDVRERAIHREPRSRRAAAHLVADAFVPCDAGTADHGRLTHAFAAPTFPALPALRRLTSPAVFFPLAL